MKLLIHSPQTLSIHSTCTDTLNRFGVQFSLLNDTVIVADQKVSLDDIDMNTLFDNSLWMLGNKIAYCPLGGEGCEFSLRIN